MTEKTAVPWEPDPYAKARSRGHYPAPLRRPSALPIGPARGRDALRVGFDERTTHTEREPLLSTGS
jgi:hypothetical protein